MTPDRPTGPATARYITLWDGEDHPDFWDGDTWTCPSCGEVYPGAKRGIAQPCATLWLRAFYEREWPADSLHHWPSGLPENLENARYWSAMRAAMRFDDE